MVEEPGAVERVVSIVLVPESMKRRYFLLTHGASISRREYADC